MIYPIFLDYLEKQSERKSEVRMIRSPAGMGVESSMSVLQSISFQT